MRVFFKDVLREELGGLTGKKVVDIGSGSGAFFDFLAELGASEICGVEPSDSNYAVSRKLFPDIPVFHGTLQDAEFPEKFDVALAVMVFEHVLDLSRAFLKIHSWLRDDGKLYLIFLDRDYLLDPVYAHLLIDYEDVEQDTTVIKASLPPCGTIYDILRFPRTYTKKAEEAGFVVERHVPLVPTRALREAMPRYAHLKRRPIRHLLVLRKKTL